MRGVSRAEAISGFFQCTKSTATTFCGEAVASGSADLARDHLVSLSASRPAARPPCALAKANVEFSLGLTSDFTRTRETVSCNRELEAIWHACRAQDGQACALIREALDSAVDG